MLKAILLVSLFLPFLAYAENTVNVTYDFDWDLPDFIQHTPFMQERMPDVILSARSDTDFIVLTGQTGCDTRDGAAFFNAPSGRNIVQTNWGTSIR